MRVVGMDGRWYLEGWCHRAEDTRMFRMDRVEELTVLDVDGTPPAAGARARPLGGHLPPRPRRPRRHAAAAARGHVGRRLLPGGVGRGRAGRRRRRAARADAHRRHRLAAPPGVAPRGPRPWSSTRPRSSPRCATAPLPRSRPTRRPPARADRAAVVGLGAALGRAAARVGRLLGPAGVAGLGEHQGRSAARCSGPASSWPSSRRAPTSCATSSPTPPRSPSHLTGCGRSIGSSGPRRRPLGTPAVPTGCRRGRAYTDARPRTTRHSVTRHHRRWTPWAGSDPPRSSSSRC